MNFGKSKINNTFFLLVAITIVSLLLFLISNYLSSLTSGDYLTALSDDIIFLKIISSGKAVEFLSPAFILSCFSLLYAFLNRDRYIPRIIFLLVTFMSFLGETIFVRYFNNMLLNEIKINIIKINLLSLDYYYFNYKLIHITTLSPYFILILIPILLYFLQKITIKK